MENIATNVTQWSGVCELQDIVPNTGICALINGQQIAIFRYSENDKLYALSNFDPFSEANVLSRGILGDLKGQPCVASPIYKHHFNLETGICLEDEKVTINCYTVRERNGQIEVHMP